MKIPKRSPILGVSIDSFSTIFEQSPISTQIFSPTGISLAANHAWEKLWGFAHADIAGTYNVRKDPLLKENKISKLIERAFRGEIMELPPIHYDTTLIQNVDSFIKYRWVKALIYPVRDASDKIQNVILQHEDITEKKVAEENLQQSRARLKAIWDVARVAMVLSDKEGTVLEANNSYYKLYGFTQEEVLGKNFSIMYPEATRVTAQARYKKIFFAKSSSAVVEATVHSKDGVQHIIESQFSFLYVKGKRSSMLSVIIDITQKKQSEALLLKEQERLQLALNVGDIGVWDWDLVNNKLDWSDKVYEIYDVPKSLTPISVDFFSSFIHSDDKERVEDGISEALAGKGHCNSQFRIVTKKGDIRWLTTSTIVHFDSKTNALRMLGATLNITEFKRFDEERNEFIGIATHELKTPVTSLKAYAEVLEQRLSKSGDLDSASHVHKMNMQLDKLTHLIEDLLDVTKIEAGKLQMHTELFDFDALVAEIVEQLQLTTNSHDLLIKGHTHKKIQADRERTGQVITNLITNAIKYSPKSDKVLLQLSSNSSTVRLDVEDFGVGIPKVKQDKIFQRFYRVSNDANRNTFPGIGLGLFLSKEIIERQKGTIFFKSISGHGSVFGFALPLKVVLLND